MSRLLLLFIATLVLGMLVFGCSREEEPARLLFLLGSRSDPDFDKLQEGDVLDPTIGERIAVFGHDDLGRTEWGSVTIDWGSGHKAEFGSGSVVSWAPAEATKLEASGVALVPLVAYLVEARTDDQLNPTSLRLKSKWKIKTGQFELSTE